MVEQPGALKHRNLLYLHHGPAQALGPLYSSEPPPNEHGAGEMAQCSRANAVLAENLNLSASTLGSLQPEKLTLSFWP